jgi:hypothetical protein
VPLTIDAAIAHQRRMFYDIATRWAAAYPSSADAAEAVAVSLELLGNPSAMDTLRRARTLSATAEDRVRIMAGEVWLDLKFVGARGSEGARAARLLADSLLRDNPPHRATEPRLLSGLAALTGRAHLAVTYARNAKVVREWVTPDPLIDVAPALRVYAAVGGPVDSLRSLEARFEKLSQLLSPQDRVVARQRWLLRAAMLAFSQFRFASLATLARTRYLPVIDAQVALARGDTVAARSILSDRRKVVAAVPPADRTVDVLLPEAELLAAMRDSVGARDWLFPTIDALMATPPQAFAEPDNAAALVRSMALLAELANQRGDQATSRRWATAVSILWSDADDFLQPVVRRMQQLSK